jgi:hypothetical protein
LHVDACVVALLVGYVGVERVDSFVEEVVLYGGAQSS